MDVVISDLPVTTTVSFAGVALTSLTAAQVSGIATAIDAKLPADAMTPALGAVTPASRRLVDLSFSVTVTNVGSSLAQAAATRVAVTNAAYFGGKYPHRRAEKARSEGKEEPYAVGKEAADPVEVVETACAAPQIMACAAVPRIFVNAEVAWEPLAHAGTFSLSSAALPKA